MQKSEFFKFQMQNLILTKNNANPQLILLSLRYLLFTKDLLNDKNTIDFQAANPYWPQILETKGTEWADYELFEKTLDTLEKEIRTCRDFSEIYRDEEIGAKSMITAKKSPVKNLEQIRFSDADPAVSLKWVDYLTKPNHSLSNLRSEFSLILSAHSSDPNIIQISNTYISDKSLKIVRECNGVVIDRQKSKIVGFPLLAERDFLCSEEQIDWKSIKTIHWKIDGHFIMIYFLNNNWEVATERKCLFFLKAVLSTYPKTCENE